MYKKILLFLFLISSFKAISAENSRASDQLFFAVNTSNAELFREAVIEYGADINALIFPASAPQPKSNNQLQKMTTVAIHATSAMHILTSDLNFKLLEIAVRELGANVNILDGKGITPLALAMQLNSPIRVRALLRLGASMNTKISINQVIRGAPVWHFAVAQNLLDVVKVFTEEFNADVDAKHGDLNLSAVEIAGFYSSLDILKFFKLRKKSKEFFLDFNHENKKLIQNRLSKDLKNINVRWIQSASGSFTPLHIAAQHNRLDVAKFLVETLGANVNMADENGHHALYWAVLHENKELIEYLLEKKSHTKTRSVNFISLVHLAVANGDENSLNLLIQHNAPVHESNTGGSTPLQLAEFFDYPNIVKILTTELNIKADERALMNELEAQFLDNFEPFLKNKFGAIPETLPNEQEKNQEDKLTNEDEKLRSEIIKISREREPLSANANAKKQEKNQEDKLTNKQKKLTLNSKKASKPKAKVKVAPPVKKASQPKAKVKVAAKPPVKKASKVKVKVALPVKKASKPKAKAKSTAKPSVKKQNKKNKNGSGSCRSSFQKKIV